MVECEFQRRLSHLDEIYESYKRGDVHLRTLEGYVRRLEERGKTKLNMQMTVRKFIEAERKYRVEHGLPVMLLFVLLILSLFFPSITGASIYEVASTSTRNGLFLFGAVLAIAIAFFCLRK